MIYLFARRTGRRETGALVVVAVLSICDAYGSTPRSRLS